MFIIFLPLSTDVASGVFIFVDDSGGKNFTSIQYAIDFAASGDTVFVFNGTYYENIRINKSLRLEGEDKETVIIDGNWRGNTISLIADNVSIINLTIQNSGTSFPDAGINISSNYNTISSNIISTNFYGITMFHAENTMIFENNISNNDHCGIYMSVSSDNIIRRNILSYHQYNGIGMYDSTNNNSITENTLSHNEFCGINMRLASYNTVMRNNISDNNIGIHVPHEKYENHVAENFFSNNQVDIEQENGLPLVELLLVVIILFCLTVFLLFWKEKSQKKAFSSKIEKHSLDARGNPCPIPLIMTKKKMAHMKKGEELEIITDDVVAKENIERFGSEKHKLVRIDKKREVFKIYIKKQ